MSRLPYGKYAAYLRKSRIDLEAEARGEEDTYKRHMRILIELSKRYGITITEIYSEKPATSGERISERPEMIRLLEDVENEQWTGILVVEVERLARGDTMDQGIVANAFKYSNTLIVTPMRVYDPQNSDDEEYFEFGLFMSRREFKTTTRRLQGGRVDGVRDGRYVGNTPPYGYQRVKLPGKGWSLEPNTDQAPIVRLIFSLYTDPDPEKRMGTARLAKHLNTMGVPTARNSKWTVATINGLLRNPVYIGRVRWGSRPLIKRRDGKSRPRKPRDQWVEVVGMHPPLIDEATFDLAQNIMQDHGHTPAPRGKISNPLAGLIRCDICGGPMVLRPYGDKNPSSIICPSQDCPNVSSYFHIIEERLLQSLREWLKSYKAQWKDKQPKTKRTDQMKLKAHEEMLKSLRKKFDDLNNQKNEAHNLLELKVYSIEVFMERSQSLAKQIDEIRETIAQAEKEIELEQKRIAARVETIPKVEHVIEVYQKTDDPGKKNAMLKSVVEQATYRKERGGRWNPEAINQFTLVLYPKLPKI
ncbi:recombinase family protein [Brevibacillus ruminantium]|uniref:Recombinase family protein n=1 Tax=Brevibacillus ruminantium TaxID=2950604 RepID=A0ABY4WKB5_9BACL|nr:recombinase family protein [Brevibacillus ruminantium]USG67595.1 recombinase family protein [Brevibacillus ruminantium]